MSRPWIPFLLLGALLAACEDAGDVADFGPTGPQVASIRASVSGDDVAPFDVYTQNVYLGGDTGPLFTLDFSNIPAVVAATNAFWTEVQASAAADRMKEIVDEIDRGRP